MEKDNEIIARRITQIQQENDLSLRQFAKRIGVAATTVSRWEHGQINTLKSSHLMKISNEFNVEALWILGRDDIPKEKETKSHSKIREEIEGKLFFCSEEDLMKINGIIDVLLGKRPK